ncbi:MAG: DUF418 domain-containing protein [Sphingomonadales bacterium]|nr:MAG: DUF418 domain-containing protein [Sphingomonadales bacterium]
MAPNSDRLHLIDALRAIALFGVITFNFTAMVMAFAGGEIMSRATSVDMGFATFDLVLIQGKARACFALLFGLGFGILMERAAAKGQGFTAFYLRRMLVLLGIGLLNLAFLFWGDILILYAVLGMGMLLFRNASDRALLWMGFALILVPPLVSGAIEGVTGVPIPNFAGLSPAAVDTVMYDTAPIYRGDDYWAYVAQNLRYYLDHYRTETGYVAMYDTSVLGLFMLGFWVARQRIAADVAAWRPVLIKLVWWCLPIGLVLSVIHATRRMGIPFEGWGYAGVTAAYAGLAIAAIGYIALFCLLIGGSGRWLQKPLAPMGRMALTGYLASNAIGSFVWYGWGLGLLGKWSMTAVNLLALAVFVGLCVFSALWLSIFRFGPAEWVWRSLTYGSLQPLLRTEKTRV